MKNPIEEKTIEELVKEVAISLKNVVIMTEEEEREDDAEAGYFEDD